MQDQLLGKHEIARSRRNFNQTLEHAVGAGHDSRLFLTLLAGQKDNRIKLLVCKEREGLLSPDDHGRQEWGNVLIKILLQQFPLGIGQLVEVNDVDSLGLQFSHQLLINFCLFLFQHIDLL